MCTPFNYNKSFDVRGELMYDTQGNLTKLTVLDKFVCNYNTPKNHIPKYAEFNTGKTPPCCNPIISDMNPILLGNNAYNKDVCACRKYVDNKLWPRVG